MAGKNQYQEHPFKIVILVMKSILCAGWSICKRVHFPVFSVSESCWLPDSPPRSSAIQQTGTHLPFSFHTRYHFSSLTVFWRLGLRQCCCSPLTRVHSVTLQGKGTSHRDIRLSPCSSFTPCHNGPGLSG